MMTSKRKRTTLKADIFEQLMADDVKRDIDIISLFHNFGVNLTQKGSSYIGLCPFHDDQNPSLSVDRSKGLFNCFGCGESGDVITLVQKMKNVDFKGSMDYLKSFKGQPVTFKPEETKPNLPLKLNDVKQVKQVKPKVEINKQQLLQEVLKQYRSDFQVSTEAQNYLEKRGLKSKDKHIFFHIGYCTGNSLLNKLSDDEKKVLMNVGILNQQGSEFFTHCLVFPIFDDMDNIVGFYGRDINDNSKFKHRYLKGKHKGIFNAKVSKVYPEQIILTECIIDAISLAELGLDNVQACYGTNGYTDDMLDIHKADGVKEIVIAFDNDDSGRDASEKLKEKFVSEGFEVRCIFPVDRKDWNEELLRGITADEIKGLIDNAEVFIKEQKKTEFKHREEKGIHIFIFGDLSYRLGGVKEAFVTNLKVNITAEMNDLYFPDLVDLCTSRSRMGYSNLLAGKFDLEPESIENHLLKILRFLEKRRDALFNPEEKKIVQYSEDEKKEALDFLKSPNLIKDTVRDITVLGYEGEKSNKLLTYIVGLSRYMSKPLSLYVLSNAGSGKSYLVETVSMLFPKNDVKFTSSMSEQAFHYMPDENFDGKIYVMGEDLHSPVIEGYIRQMQTEGRLTRDVVQKDEKTGVMQTVNITHKVRLVFMSTSTKMDVNIENLSRCILLKIDESAEQTKRVLKAQRDNDDFLSQLEKEHLRPQIIKKHIISQSLLKPVRIYNPYAKYIQFPTHKALFRRSQPYFLLLIKTICYWRQYQKQPALKDNPYTGEKEEWFECDLIDYELARTLFLQNNLLSYVEDLPQPLVDLYESIREMVLKKAQDNDLSVVETSFIQREVREIARLSNESIKKYLRKLVDYEYLQLIAGRRHGTRFSYKLREDAPINQVNPASIIPTASQIKDLITTNN